MKARSRFAVVSGAATVTWWAASGITDSWAPGTLAATSSWFAIGVELSRSPAMRSSGQRMSLRSARRS